ncbi:MAG: hypothetical protein DI586_08545 [Micavibrio aeruginosavorus]|uniref:Uncharacterized protein n=1 Tax=Micavibrio aeruginosavorus TaxID=349221 RepID=A0A2W5FM49_9BACT|nr:MAG: hypothetical protein DI586_08545 [Micavibrio aeruginosavorus]
MENVDYEVRKLEQKQARELAAEAMADRKNAVDVIQKLAELKTGAAILWIGGLAELTPEAKTAAINALKEDGSKNAAQRLGWLAHDHHSDSDKILDVLRCFEPDIAGSIIQTIENRQFERAITDLRKAIDHKEDFNRYARAGHDRFDKRIIGIAMKMVSPDQFERHLKNDSELPDLKAALKRAVHSVPSLKEDPKIKTALAQLSLDI